MREEKEQCVCQVQELEASVAELKTQLGKLGLEGLGAGLVAEGCGGCLGGPLGMWMMEGDCGREEEVYTRS